MARAAKRLKIHSPLDQRQKKSHGQGENTKYIYWYTGYILFVVFMISTAKLPDSSPTKYTKSFFHPLAYLVFVNIFPPLSMPNILNPLFI